MNIKKGVVIYAVRKGNQVGLFYTKKDLQKAISGYPKAEYESFKDELAAMIYLTTT